MQPIVSASAPPPSCAAPPSGFVGWWPGDGNYKDIQGPTFENGVPRNGAGFAPGKVGQAFSFDGTNDYVLIGDPIPPALQIQNEISIDAWIYLTEYPSGDPYTGLGLIAGSQFDTNAAGATIFIDGRTNPDGQTAPAGHIHFQIGDGGAWHSSNSQTQVPLNQWVHIAATRKAGEVAKIYYNGVSQPVASLPWPSGAISYTGAWFSIGQQKDINRPFKGLIDEVHVANRALTASEVAAVYNADSYGLCKPLCIQPPSDIRSWWPGDDNTGDIIGDNNGVNVGAATYAAGKVGRAFSFDGTNYVEVADSPSLRPPTYTVDAWIYPTNVAGNHNVVFKGDHEYLLQVRNGNILFGSRSANGTYAEFQGSLDVPVNTWSHVAITQDATTKRIYVNGVLDPATQEMDGHYTSNLGPLRIGTHFSLFEFFSGLIDEVDIIGRPLSQAEIQAIVNAGSNGKCHLCSQPPSNLLSWWPGDLNGFDIASGYNGTLYGDTTYAAGVAGQAFSLDGGADYIRANNTLAINGGPQATYEAWVYPTAIAPSPGEYFAIMGVGDATVPHWTTQQCRLLYWRAAESPAGTSRFYVDCGLDNNDNYFSRMSSRDYPINSWHHVAGTFNGGALNLYVDGVLDNGATAGTGGSQINNLSEHYAWLGALVRADSSVVTSAFPGLIDDARIYDRALSASEILDAYNAGGSGTCIPDRGKAYVPNGGSGDLSVIDIGVSTVGATIAAPQQFGFVAIKNDGSKAYVSGAALSKVTVIDTATNAVLTNFTLPGATHGLAVDLTGTKLYVAQEFGSNVWVLNADTGALLTTIPIGANPYGVAAAPDGRHVYTSNYSSGTMSAIRTSDYGVETIATGSVPYGIAVTPDSSRVYVANAGSNSVSVIDAATNTITTSITFACPTGVAVNKTGTRVYVGSCSSNNLLAINTADNTGVEIPVGATTEGVSVSADGTRVLAAARTSNAVLSINAATKTVTTIPVGTSPYAVGLFIAQGLPAPTPVPAPECSARPAGLTSWWRGEGTTLDHRKAHPASFAGGTAYGSGMASKGFSFDGVDDSVSVPAFNMGSNWTVEGWINPAACSDNSHCALFTRSSGNQDGMVLMYLGPGHSWSNEFGLNIAGGGTWQISLRSGVKYSPSSWHHVAATKSGDTYTLYVNGIQRAQQTLGGVADDYQLRNISLGHWNYGTAAYLQGKIDEVAVYKRALAPAEITAIAAAVSYGKCAAGQTLDDMDGDQLTDMSIFRPSGANGAEWWWLKSTGGNGAVQFGVSTDTIVASDYTGDGKTDVAFWRPSTGQWYILRSEDFSFYAFPFGGTGDIPAPADYDGDGKTDATVFRPSTTTWYINKSTGGTGITVFGATGDKPVPEDYDGDGKADIAVFRPNGTGGAEWWIAQSSGGVFATQFGQPTDKALPADYTGDGKADIAFWMPSNGFWYVLRSDDFSYYAFPFGGTTDVPVPADYDGDARVDAGVFRSSNSNWYISRSTAGLLIQQFGSAGDVPVPNAFVR